LKCESCELNNRAWSSFPNKEISQSKFQLKTVYSDVRDHDMLVLSCVNIVIVSLAQSAGMRQLAATVSVPCRASYL